MEVQCSNDDGAALGRSRKRALSPCSTVQTSGTTPAALVLGIHEYFGLDSLSISFSYYKTTHCILFRFVPLSEQEIPQKSTFLNEITEKEKSPPSSSPSSGRVLDKLCLALEVRPGIVHPWLNAIRRLVLVYVACT